MLVTYLLVIALMLDAIISRKSINPARIGGYVLLAFALFGSDIWNWSRSQPGAGLPSIIAAPRFDQSLAFMSLSISSIGLLVAGIVTARFVRRASGDGARVFHYDPRMLLGVSGSLFAIWCVGQGASLFERSVYLLRDGNGLIAKWVGAAAPLLAVAILILGIVFSKGYIKTQIALSLVWFVSLLAVGTRLAVLFPLAAAGLVLYMQFTGKNRSPVRFFISLATVYVLSFVALGAFWLTLVARSNTHGLLHLFELLAVDGGPNLLDPRSWLPTLQMLGASASAAFPITELSALNAPELDYILGSANPLPAGLNWTANYEAERIWPYEWVPQSYWGQIFGAGGPIITFAMSFASGLISNLSLWLAIRRNNLALKYLVIIFAVTAVFVGLQYPARNYFRIFSFVYLLPIGFLVLSRFRTLTHRNLEMQDSKVTVERFPPNKAIVQSGPDSL
jgi:hypothetical protein